MMKTVFRQKVQYVFRADWIVATLIFLIHIGLIAVSRTIALVAIWFWLFVLMHKEGRRNTGLQKPAHWHWWFSGPVIGLILVSGTAMLLWLIYGWSEQNMFYDMAHAVGDGYGLLKDSDYILAPYALLGVGWLLQSPLLEEPLFRGIMLSTYQNKWGNKTAMIIQAMAFAIVHPLNNVSWFVSIFVAGIVYGLITKESKSIWPAVLAHGAYNFGIIWIAFQYMPEFIF